MAGGPGLGQGLPDGQSDPEGKRYISMVPWSENLGSHPLAWLGTLFTILLLATSPAFCVMRMVPHAGEFKPRSLTLLSQHILAEGEQALEADTTGFKPWLCRLLVCHLGKGLSDPVSLYFKKR